MPNPLDHSVSWVGNPTSLVPSVTVMRIIINSFTWILIRAPWSKTGVQLTDSFIFLVFGT